MLWNWSRQIIFLYNKVHDRAIKLDMFSYLSRDNNCVTLFFRKSNSFVRENEGSGTFSIHFPSTSSMYETRNIHNRQKSSSSTEVNKPCLPTQLKSLLIDIHYFNRKIMYFPSWISWTWDVEFSRTKLNTSASLFPSCQFWINPFLYIDLKDLSYQQVIDFEDNLSCI